MESGDAATISLVLNEKSTPYALLPQGHGWTPLQYWILRRHGYYRPPLGSPTRSIPKLTNQEVVSIQRQLRELTPDEANFFTGTGGRFSDWGNLPDGGAALFRYLRQRGAKLHVPNQDGTSIFDRYTTFSPALVVELDKLSDTELRELSCPIDSAGLVKMPLYAEAKSFRNRSITDFLDKRKLNDPC
jgi:hypothetical protein